jgi:uncharacterized protein (TIGR02266 family)
VTSHFRRSRREPVTLRVRYRKDGSALEHDGTTSDIGVGGAFIEASRPPPIGTTLELLVTAPTAWDPLAIRGVVRWIAEPGEVGPAGFGVEFGELPGPEAAALFELLSATGYAGSEV